MGTWGIGIFQNDIADNVKTVYVNKLKIGKSDEEALEELIAENTELLSDNEDALDFWLALSSVMYDYGRLNEKVRTKALALIESDDDSERWTIKENSKRKCELEKLKTKLCSEMPARKKVAVTKKFDVRIKGLEDILPVTYLKFSPELPDNIKEIDDLPFIMNCKRDDSEEYRFLWLYDGFSRIKSKFVFSGNYDFRRPDKKDTLSFDDKLYIMENWHNIAQYILD